MNSSFVPSNVCPSFPSSSFQNTEKEILAAQIVTFLAKNSDVWDTVVEMRAFFDHTETEDEVHPMYQKPFTNPILSQGCVNAMHYLVDDGFIEWIEERASFKVTDKFVEFYSGYVVTA